jgi:hypothetical protein
MLSKDANPSFHNVILFAHALGMEFKLTPAWNITYLDEKHSRKTCPPYFYIL